MSGLSRYEYKYVVGRQAAERIRLTLSALLAADEHANAGGEYFVRSVYFDDDDFSAYREKIAGVGARSKYRLRFYDMDPSRLTFEVKHKRGQLVLKRAVVVSRDTAERLLSGEALLSAERKAAPLAAFDANGGTLGLKPAVIVDYTRAAFVYPVNDVRVTLDSDVRAESYRRENVFSRRCGVPAMEDGESILEVKFADRLPPFIAQALSDIPKIQCANSKYCNCLSAYL